MTTDTIEKYLKRYFANDGILIIEDVKQLKRLKSYIDIKAPESFKCGFAIKREQIDAVDEEIDTQDHLWLSSTKVLLDSLEYLPEL